MKTKTLAKWLKGAAYVAVGGVLLYSAVAILTSVVALVAALAIGSAAWAFAPVYLELLAYGQATAMLSIFKGDPKYGLRRVKIDMIQEYDQRKTAVLSLGESVNFAEQGLQEMRRSAPEDVALFEGNVIKQREAYEQQLTLLDRAKSAIEAFDIVIDRASRIYDQHQRMNKSLGLLNMLNGGARAEMRQRIEDTSLIAIQDEVAKSMAQLDMAMRGETMGVTKATKAELNRKEKNGEKAWTTGQRHDTASMAAMADKVFKLDSVGELSINSITLDTAPARNIPFEILSVAPDGRERIAFLGELQAGVIIHTPKMMNIRPTSLEHTDVNTKYRFSAHDVAFEEDKVGVHINLDVQPRLKNESPYDRFSKN